MIFAHENKIESKMYEKIEIQLCKNCINFQAY